MPNWVRNRLTIDGVQEEINAFLDAVKGENGVIDFDKIIPMPPTLGVENSTMSSIAYDIITNQASQKSINKFNKLSEEEREKYLKIGETMKFNMETYGYRDWYYWSIGNWGTKWNACHCELYDNVIEFDTAWSAPYPIYGKLAELFPNLIISFEYADEDCGYNVGRGSMEHGEISYCILDDGSKEAFEQYMDLHNNWEDWIWNEERQEYVWKEEDDEDCEDY